MWQVVRKLQMNERELERMEERAETAELYVDSLLHCLALAAVSVPVMWITCIVWYELGAVFRLPFSHDFHMREMWKSWIFKC